MKTWEKPQLLALSNNKINSGANNFGAERILTCNGAINTIDGSLIGGVYGANCYSTDPNATYMCTGIVATSAGYIYVTQNAASATINLVCS